MEKIDLRLDNLDRALPDDFTPEQAARCKTLFLKRLSLAAHRFYGGKIQMVPKVGAFGFNWFNVWYTPGVSQVSTAIRDNQEASYELSNRGNLVADRQRFHARVSATATSRRRAGWASWRARRS